MAPPALWDSLEWYEALAVWLLSERRRGEASPIHGYVQYLPQPVEFSDAPLEWSEAELAELRYPPIAIAIEEIEAVRIKRTNVAIAIRIECLISNIGIGVIAIITGREAVSIIVFGADQSITVQIDFSATFFFC